MFIYLLLWKCSLHTLSSNFHTPFHFRYTPTWLQSFTSLKSFFKIINHHCFQLRHQVFIFLNTSGIVNSIIKSLFELLSHTPGFILPILWLLLLRSFSFFRSYIRHKNIGFPYGSPLYLHHLSIDNLNLAHDFKKHTTHEFFLSSHW